MAPSGAHAGAHTRTIVMASPPQGWPPFIIIAPDPQKNRGIMLDVLREAMKASGHDLTLALYPEKRSRLMLKEGGIDAYAKAKEWVDNPGLYLWTDPVLTITDTVVFRKSGRLPIPTSLDGLHLGVVHGFVYPTLEPLFQQGTILRHTAMTTANLLLMVQRGHIDGAVTNRHVAEWIIKNNAELSAEAFAFGKTPIASAPYRFAFPKTEGNELFIAQFNRELAAMKQDGRLKTIMDKYK